MSGNFFQNLFREGLKIKTSISSSSQKAFSAIKNEQKIISNPLSADQRLTICNNCPNFSKRIGRCDLCGCFVSIKVRLDFESCPSGKW